MADADLAGQYGYPPGHWLRQHGGQRGRSPDPRRGHGRPVVRWATGRCLRSSARWPTSCWLARRPCGPKTTGRRWHPADCRQPKRRRSAGRGPHQAPWTCPGNNWRVLPGLFHARQLKLMGVGAAGNLGQSAGSERSGHGLCPDLCQRAIVWRMRGEVQQLATYPQARLCLTAVCKTVGFASFSTAISLDPCAASMCGGIRSICSPAGSATRHAWSVGAPGSRCLRAG
jgi:hypothetical protein